LLLVRGFSFAQQPATPRNKVDRPTPLTGIRWIAASLLQTVPGVTPNALSCEVRHPGKHWL